MKKAQHIFSKQAATLATYAIVPVTLFFFAVFSVFFGFAVMALVDQLVLETMGEASDSIEDRLDRVERLLNTMAEQPEVLTEQSGIIPLAMKMNYLDVLQVVRPGEAVQGNYSPVQRERAEALVQAVRKSRRLQISALSGGDRPGGTGAAGVRGKLSRTETTQTQTVPFDAERGALVFFAVPVPKLDQDAVLLAATRATTFTSVVEKSLRNQAVGGLLLDQARQPVDFMGALASDSSPGFSTAQALDQPELTRTYAEWDKGTLLIYEHERIARLDWLLIIRIDLLKLGNGVVLRYALGAVLILLVGVAVALLVRTKFKKLSQPVDELIEKARTLKGEDDSDTNVFDFITTAINTTQNLMQPTECFFSLDRRSDKLELAFGDFEAMTGYALPLTRAEIFDLFCSIIHPDDVEAFRNSRTRFNPESPDEEYTFNFRLNTRSGATLHIHSVENDVYEGNQLTNTMIRLMDVSEQQAREAHLTLQSQMDAFSGLYTKKAFEEKASTALHDAGSAEGMALALLDLDNFKQVNDVYGHLTGDEVIKSVAGLMLGRFRTSDIVGRVGGDEFAVFCLGVSARDVLALKFEGLAQEVKKAMDELMPSHNSSLSVGLVFGDETDNFGTLYQKADIALYAGKHQGKGKVVLFGEGVVAPAHEGDMPHV